MGRTLRYLGAAFVAGAIWLVIADLARWMPAGVSDRYAKPCFLAGAVLLAGGFLSSILGTAAHRLRGGRCVRCGAPTGKGQAYCWDHLQETINEFRDQSAGKQLRSKNREA